MAERESQQGWEYLVRYHRRTITAMDVNLRARFGRSLDDYDVLQQLRAADRALTMGQLASSLLVANSSCNRIVGRLADDGLVERSPGPQDRRQVLVGLTRAGRALHRRMAAVHTRDIEHHFVHRLDREQRTAMTEALGALLDDGPLDD